MLFAVAATGNANLAINAFGRRPSTDIGGVWQRSASEQ